MTVEEQVKIIETQMNSAGLLIFEKLAYIESFIKPDPEFSQEAIDIVMGNICRDSKEESGC
jgi:hypothetical protein